MKPPAPRSPAIIQMISWIKNPYDMMEKMQRQYGDTFTLKMPDGQPVTFLSCPNDVKTLFTLNTKIVERGRGTELLEPLVGQSSLLLLKGNEHKAQRKMIMPHMRGKQLDGFQNVIRETTQMFTQSAAEKRAIELRTFMESLTLEIMIKFLFGDISGNLKEVKSKLHNLLAMTATPLKSSLLFFPILRHDLGTWSPGSKLNKLHAEIDSLLIRSLETCRKEKTGTSFFSAILKQEHGKLMKSHELIDLAKTLLVAGHETVATTLTWLLYSIGTHENIYRKLKHTTSNNGNSQYLRNVINETLRIYPVAPISFDREILEETTFSTFTCTAKSLVVPAIYLIHRNTAIYENPSAFKPERFENRTFSPHEFLPFGGGHRRCLGDYFAVEEMYHIINSILLDYDFTLLPPPHITPRRRGLTVAPSAPLFGTFTPNRK